MHVSLWRHFLFDSLEPRIWGISDGGKRERGKEGRTELSGRVEGMERNIPALLQGLRELLSGVVALNVVVMNSIFFNVR